VEQGMSADEVLAQISQLRDNGESLAKKHIKKQYPNLMKYALYYYPSWEHALHKIGYSAGHE
jgi:hypothetical protein